MPLTVKQLIHQLGAFPENSLVVQSKDAEGNNFSPLASVSEGFYLAEGNYSGVFYDEREDDDATVLAICLWPTN